MYGPPRQYGSSRVGDSSAAAARMTGTAHVEDFRQVTPRTSDMDDGASASTANTGARSVEPAAGATTRSTTTKGGAGERKGADSSSSPATSRAVTNNGPHAARKTLEGAAKTPATSNIGTARGSKKDKSPEELSAAEALITTANQRHAYHRPTSGHPGPPYTQYYPYYGGRALPPPPPHGSYNSVLPLPPQTPGAHTAGAGVSQPQPTNQNLPSDRDLPSPSAVAAAVVAASKEIAAGGRSAAPASPEKASRPDLLEAGDAMSTPARKKATKGGGAEDDVVGALLEMKTSSAEKKKEQQQTSPGGEGGGTNEGTDAPVPTIDPAEWAKLLPLRLSTPKDELHLNRLHCFIRSTLLELFVMPVGKSTDTNLQGQQYQAGEIRYHSVALAHRRPRPPHPPPPYRHPRFAIPPGPPHHVPPPPPAQMMAAQAPLAQGQQRPISAVGDGAPSKAPIPAPPGSPVGNTAASKKMAPPSSFLRVGLRCVFCVRAQREQAEQAAQRGGRPPPRNLGSAPMGTMYPKNLAEIYNLVSRFQRIHFKECRFVPPTIRKQFDDHKESDKSRGKREYWIKSAKAIGLVDDKNGRGIRFIPPNAFQQSEPTAKPSSTTAGGVSGGGETATSSTDGARSLSDAKVATDGIEDKVATNTKAEEEGEEAS